MSRKSQQKDGNTGTEERRTSPVTIVCGENPPQGKSAISYWSFVNPKTPWNLYQDVHNKMCKNDIMFRLLFDSDTDSHTGDDFLNSHVFGLISRASDKEPGIIINTFGEDKWSKGVLETFDLLKQLHSDPVLGDPLYRNFKRTMYHAVLFICLPHISTFAQYVAQHSLYPHKIIHFIEHTLLPAETAFFFEGKPGLHNLNLWVSFLRNRWCLYVSSK